MELTFSPSPDVACVLNALLDTYERRISQAVKLPTENIIPQQSGVGATYDPATQRSGRAIRINLSDINLPSYFSQTDPTPRLTANEQFQILQKTDVISLVWLPGETGHILHSVTLKTEHVTRAYSLLNRPAKATQQKTLESLLLAEKFRYTDDWRARALRLVLANLHAGKSPTPFSLTDTGLNLDLLTVMEALSALQAETPYRVFSVRVFNDSKRFENIKNLLVSLARLGNLEWKRIATDEVLRELNLVPNPNYIHLAGNWQLMLETGEIISLSGFSPSVGFPAAQTAQLQRVEIHADAVLCIENLTSFHEFARHERWNLKHAFICTYGNPSPAVRRLLRLVPENIPIFHWSDLDYGGFNILSQLRRLVSDRIQPYHMGIATLEANYSRSRPLTVADKTNLKKLLIRPELQDVRETIAHLLKRSVKLEQEGVEKIDQDAW